MCSVSIAVGAKLLHRSPGQVQELLPAWFASQCFKSVLAMLVPSNLHIVHNKMEMLKQHFVQYVLFLSELSRHHAETHSRE